MQTTWDVTDEEKDGYTIWNALVEGYQVTLVHRNEGGPVAWQAVGASGRAEDVHAAAFAAGQAVKNLLRENEASEWAEPPGLEPM